MEIVATMSWTAVDRPNADHWQLERRTLIPKSIQEEDNCCAIEAYDMTSSCKLW